VERDWLVFVESGKRVWCNENVIFGFGNGLCKGFFWFHVDFWGFFVGVLIGLIYVMKMIGLMEFLLSDRFLEFENGLCNGIFCFRVDFFGL
jgi:hypothetical protein